jgi:hypothetical protein
MWLPCSSPQGMRNDAHALVVLEQQHEPGAARKADTKGEEQLMLVPVPDGPRPMARLVRPEDFNSSRTCFHWTSPPTGNPTVRPISGSSRKASVLETALGN